MSISLHEFDREEYANTVLQGIKSNDLKSISELIKKLTPEQRIFVFETCVEQIGSEKIDAVKLIELFTDPHHPKEDLLMKVAKLNEILFFECMRQFANDNIIYEVLASLNSQDRNEAKISNITKWINKVTIGLEKEEIMSLCIKVLKAAIPKGNITLIQSVLEVLAHAEENEDASDEYLSIHLNQQEHAKLGMLLSVPDKSQDIFSEYSLQFSGFGRIKYEGGLLTALQVNKRKKSYKFNPTILNENNVKSNEMREYIEALKNMNPPIRERFVLAGEHWICGDIEINEKGEVNVLLVDSLGDIGEDHHIIEKFNENFSGKKLNFYVDKTVRQNSSSGCSVFALDDVRHLYTVERYIPKVYKNNLFKYLEGEHQRLQKENSIEMQKKNVKVTNLPLALVRTAQTSKLIKGKDGQRSLIEQRTQEEQVAPVKKAKLGSLITAKIDAEAGFETINSKLQNTRLNKKLNKMREYNIELMLSIEDFKTFKAEMNQYSLNSFKKRAEKQNKAQEHAEVKEEYAESMMALSPESYLDSGSPPSPPSSPPSPPSSLSFSGSPPSPKGPPSPQEESGEPIAFSQAMTRQHLPISSVRLQELSTQINALKTNDMIAEIAVVNFKTFLKWVLSNKIKNNQIEEGIGLLQQNLDSIRMDPRTKKALSEALKIIKTECAVFSPKPPFSEFPPKSPAKRK